MTAVDTLHVDGEGDCYEAAVLLMLALPPEQKGMAYLCHGTALGNGGEALGIRYGHAWVELEFDAFGLSVVMVRDTSNGKDSLRVREDYYEDGTIEGVKRYTYMEMLRLCHATDHYGPWRVDD